MSELRRGVLMGIGAYFSWGVLPLYWRLFRPAAGAIEILAHRVVWSLLFLVFLLLRSRELGKLRELGGRRLRLLMLAAVLIGLNWGVYIWGVNAGRVVETSLGYFINPLVTVMLGVVVLRERLRRIQWMAIGLVAVAVAVLTIDYGRLPWVAIVLATSFGLYGLLKKQAGASAVQGLAIETATLFVPSLGYLFSLEVGGHAAFGHGWTISALLASTGVITALPLLSFAGAANRIPLRVIGPLQYISPTFQFLCGVVVFHEAMPPSRWLGFILVWAALAVFVVDGAFQQRRLAVARVRA